MCHETGKKNNELAYLSTIRRKGTVCQIIYGDQNKAGVAISSCFHTVHTNCYIAMKK